MPCSFSFGLCISNLIQTKKKKNRWYCNELPAKHLSVVASVLDLIGGGSRSTTPASLGSRKSPTADQGVQVSGAVKKDDKKLIRPIQPPMQRGAGNVQRERRDSGRDGHQHQVMKRTRLFLRSFREKKNREWRCNRWKFSAGLILIQKLKNYGTKNTNNRKNNIINILFYGWWII